MYGRVDESPAKAFLKVSRMAASTSLNSSQLISFGACAIHTDRWRLLRKTVVPEHLSQDGIFQLVNLVLYHVPSPELLQVDISVWVLQIEDVCGRILATSQNGERVHFNNPWLNPESLAASLHKS